MIFVPIFVIITLFITLGIFGNIEDDNLFLKLVYLGILLFIISPLTNLGIIIDKELGEPVAEPTIQISYYIILIFVGILIWKNISDYENVYLKWMSAISFIAVIVAIILLKPLIKVKLILDFLDNVTIFNILMLIGIFIGCISNSNSKTPAKPRTSSDLQAGRVIQLLGKILFK